MLVNLAVLDVFHPQIDSAIVTPHLAGATLDNFASVVACSVENTKAVLRGEPPPLTTKPLLLRGR